jgi:hypothetical protein
MLAREYEAALARSERSDATEHAAAKHRAAEVEEQLLDAASMTLTVLLQLCGLGKNQADDLRASGWHTVLELRSANLNDMVAAHLSPPDARRLLNAVRATSDPRTELREMGGVGCAAFGHASKRSHRPHTVAIDHRPNLRSPVETRPLRTSHGRRRERIAGRRPGPDERGRITAANHGSRPSTVSFADSRQTAHSTGMHGSVLCSAPEPEVLPPQSLAVFHSESKLDASRAHGDRPDTDTCFVGLPDVPATSGAHSTPNRPRQQQRPTTQPSPSPRNVALLMPRPSTVMGTMGNIGHDCAPSATRAAAHAAYAASWSTSTTKAVRYAAQRYAWSWVCRHPPDRVHRQQWGQQMIHEGRFSQVQVRKEPAAWTDAMCSAYESWVAQIVTPLRAHDPDGGNAQLGCHLVEPGVAAVGYTEELILILATMQPSLCVLRDWLLSAHDRGQGVEDDSNVESDLRAKQLAARVQIVLRVRDRRMQRALNAWLDHWHSIRASFHQLCARLKRLQRERVQRCFEWWVEIWAAGMLGRRRRQQARDRELIAKGREAVEKEARQQRWAEWDAAAAKREAADKERRRVEAVKSRRRRLLGEDRAKREQLQAAKLTSVKRMAEQEAAEAARKMAMQDKILEQRRQIRQLEAQAIMRAESRQRVAQAQREETERRRQNVQDLLFDAAVEFKTRVAYQAKQREQQLLQARRTNPVTKRRAELARAQQVRQQKTQQVRAMVTLDRVPCMCISRDISICHIVCADVPNISRQIAQRKSYFRSADAYTRKKWRRRAASDAAAQRDLVDRELDRLKVSSENWQPKAVRDAQWLRTYRNHAARPVSVGGAFKQLSHTVPGILDSSCSTGHASNK